MNTSSLAIVAGLSVLMLAIFVLTGQQWKLTVTAVLVTTGLAAGAVFFYGREDARQADDDYEDEPVTGDGQAGSDAALDPDDPRPAESD